MFSLAYTDLSAVVLGMHQMYIPSGLIFWEQASWDRVWGAMMLIYSSEQQIQFGSKCLFMSHCLAQAFSCCSICFESQQCLSADFSLLVSLG